MEKKNCVQKLNVNDEYDDDDGDSGDKIAQMNSTSTIHIPIEIFGNVKKSGHKVYVWTTTKSTQPDMAIKNTIII